MGDGEPVELATATEDVVLRPVTGRNPFEEAVERIVQAIKLGAVRTGERLPPERELATRLGVSRVTLRSVIRALQQAGYVESRRGRAGGSFVTWQPRPPDDEDARAIAVGMGDDLRDALRFRSVLEPAASAFAASAALSPQQRALLAARLDETSAASLEDYRLADSRLHLAIAELAGSPSLAAAVADVRVRLNDLLRAIPLLSEAVAHSNEQHHRIVGAILRADPVTARSAMEEHLSATAALLAGFLG
ncbi:MAG: FadR family transcriptional regulator [Actinobacteria bacterium]|nr:FadR family transcriptional regulator [Actinomycetota bacterium]MBI3688425.1 FadR family transcriptional regulator [Actinomycetota bacterium]